MELVKKKEIVSTFLKHNILVSREILNKLNEPKIIDDWHAALSKGKHPKELLEAADGEASVKVIWEYNEKPKKRTVQDFVDYFNARYRALEKMLRSRQELQGLTAIARLRSKKDRETVSVIGIVVDKSKTKNEHIMLTIEDTSGSLRILVTKEKKDLYQQAEDLVFDEVIGISGTASNDIMFANTIINPDLPINEQKKIDEEVYVASLSCIHVGSAGFEHEKFQNFVDWLNGDYGDEKEKAIAKKVKYVFITGDVVDGIGIYPAQENELAIKSIAEQYKECARLLSKVPKNVTLIIGPGNHDIGRIAEPQTKISYEYAKELWELPNVVMVCNPCVLNIHSSKDFEGFNVLMYHGYSFDDYGEIVPSIRESGAHISDRAPLIMRFLLQRRHLAPQHATSLYIPDPKNDPMVIESVPDLFVAGHIHKAGALQYRGTSIICGSCFQAKTKFQEKVGHDPDPGVVPVINLNTRHVDFMKF